jgi:hypothetical protein
MIEIGTRVTGSTLFSTFTGTVYDYKTMPNDTQIYIVLLEDNITYVAVPTVTPITEAQT